MSEWGSHQQFAAKVRLRDQPDSRTQDNEPTCASRPQGWYLSTSQWAWNRLSPRSGR